MADAGQVEAAQREHDEPGDDQHEHHQAGPAPVRRGGAVGTGHSSGVYQVASTPPRVATPAMLPGAAMRPAP